jgi:hypothetical protein
MYLLVRYYQVRRMGTNKQLSKLLNAVSIFNYDFAKTAGFYRFENMHVCVSVWINRRHARRNVEAVLNRQIKMIIKFVTVTGLIFS